MAMREHCEPAEFIMSGHTQLYPISDGQHWASDIKEERNNCGKTTCGHSHLFALISPLVLVLLVFAYFAGIHCIRRKGTKSCSSVY